MFAALCAALVAAVLSLGGASLVLAGGDNGNGHGAGGNGNGQGYDAGKGNSDGTGKSWTDGGDKGYAGNGGDQGTGSGRADGGKTQNKGGGKTQSKAGGSDERWSKPGKSQPKSQVKSESKGGGSHSTGTSGPGNSSQGCDGTHHSDTGHGANQGGPYDNTCDGSPSGNGNGNGTATGKPCAGCVGNADDKNPKGQMPNGSDHNKGYECDKNHGIGRSNPAHTGCKSSDTPDTTDKGDSKDDHKGGDKGDQGEQPGGTDEGGQHGCPTPELKTSLAKVAALALHAFATKHPEVLKLAEFATVKANENCGQVPDKGDTAGEKDHGKITICHATGSATNPYVEITISKNGLHGHGKHADDIIPAPAGGCPKGETAGEGNPGGHECPNAADMPAGNDDKGDKDCGKPECPKADEMPAGESGKDCGKPEHEKITICHATGSMTNPYVEITIDEHGLNGHEGHEDDIIPAPAGGCPRGEQSGGEQPGGNTRPPTGGEQPGTPVTPQQPVQAPADVTAPATRTPAEQGVLGVRTGGGSPEQAPATGQAPANEVLGANAQGGSAPTAASAPAAAQKVLAANDEGGSLPFTGTDALLVLFLGCLTLLLGLGIQKLTRRTN